MNLGINAYITDFQTNHSKLPGNNIPWMVQLRQSAMDRFEFPTSKNEEWKYTRVAPLEKQLFAASTPTTSSLTIKQISHIIPENAHLLVFVDGYYAAHLSHIFVSKEIVLTNLTDAIQNKTEQIRKYLDKETTSFVALNTACMSDGVFLQVPKNVTIKESIHCLFITTEANHNKAAHLRNIICVGENSQLTLIEHYYGMGDAHYFTNVVTEVDIENNAHFEHYKLQQESEEAIHIANLVAHQLRDSRLTGHSISLGGQLVRNDLNMRLAAEGVECALNGLYKVSGQQHVDYHTTIHHTHPHGKSREVYKGIVDGQARAVFNGKIVVSADAQKTDAQLNNKNLLLSKSAEIDTKPELQIDADDVQCSHGATVGQLSEESLFYLRSRGLSADTAKALLTYAFAKEIIDRMPLKSMRQRCQKCVLDHLMPGEDFHDI